MTKQLVTYFFSVALLASIIAPTYISIVDGNCEISIVEDLGEEEENKGEDLAKDLELKVFYSEGNSSFSLFENNKEQSRYRSKDYFLDFNSLNSPPPEPLFG